MSTVKERWLHFLKRGEEKYGDRFDYSETEGRYLDHNSPLPIRCKKHDIQFDISPALHLHFLNGGCSECEKEQRHEKYKEERRKVDIISEFKAVHGDKYDYSETDYAEALDNDDKLKIICPIHGAFYMTRWNHLRGAGCRRCAKNYINTEEFIEYCKKLYGDKYSYEKTVYAGSHTNVIITCKEHNCDFKVLPTNFTKINTQDVFCPLCGKAVQSQDDFIIKAENRYPNLFDYKLVNFVNINTPVKIICKKCGLVNTVIPNVFLHSISFFVCSCFRSGKSKLEDLVGNFLSDNGIIFKREHTFSDLRDINPLRVDFYIEPLNLIIECQGLQHFEERKWYGGKEGFEARQKHDRMKLDYCKKHKIRLIYFMDEKTFNSRFISSEFSEVPAYYNLNLLKNELKNGE